MAQEILVIPDIKVGEKILAILDEANFPIKVALWLLSDRYEEWRLFLASPLDDRLPPGEARLQMVKAFPREERHLIFDIPMNFSGTRTPFVRELRKRFRNVDDVAGRRIRGQRIADRWVEDSCIYRLY